MSMNQRHDKGELEKRYKNFNPNAKFTIVSQWVAQDGDLSPRALGIYLYLASNNHTFKFSENGLYHHFKKAGLWTIKKSIKELENNHLIKRARPTKDKHGKWTHGSKWNLYYLPDKIARKLKESHENSNLSVGRKPSVRNPSVRIPSVRKPSTNKYQLKQVSGETNTNPSSHSSSVSNKSLSRDGLWFKAVFGVEPTPKVKRYFRKWIDNGYSDGDVFRAMNVTNKNSICKNPNAIASYINQCLKYPPRRSDDNSKYNRKAQFR